MAHRSGYRKVQATSKQNPQEQTQIQPHSRSFATPPPQVQSEVEEPKTQSAQQAAQYNALSLPIHATGGVSPGGMPIMPKLTIGAVGDKYEQEADAVAAQVVQQINSPAPTQNVQREENTSPNALRLKPLNKLIQRMGEEEEELQAKPMVQLQGLSAGGTATPELEESIQQQRGKGESLSDSIRQPMEQAFGADFSGVKVHTDSQSNQLNQSIQAKAFTTGQDIFFRQGAYAPSSQVGQELLAHELTHVVQQNGNAVQPGSTIQRDDDDKSPFSGGFKGDEPDDPVGEVNTEMFGDTANKQLIKSGGGGEAFFQDPESTRTVTTGEGTVTTTETSSKAFEGAGFAIQKITEADDTTLKEAFQVLARAGAFGEAAAKKQMETSSGSTFTASGEASGFAGVEGEVISVKVIDAINGIQLLARATIKAGVGFDLKGALEAATIVGGIELKAKLEGKLSGFAGVMAEAKGQLSFNAIDGLLASGRLYAMAGAKSEGEVTVSVNAGDLGIDGGGKYEAIAGAEAEAAGKLQVSMEGISASGKLEAFAGAKVKASASASLKYKGRILIKVAGELEAQAGVGGSLEGEFSFQGGKLVIKGKLAAALGIGGGAGVALEVDFKEIGKVILEKMKEAFTKKVLDNRSIADQDRKPADDLTPEDKQKTEQELYDAVFPYIKAYAAKKAKLVSSTSLLGNRKADHLVKRENIQEIIDNKIRKKGDLSQKLLYKFSDAVLERAVRDACGDQLKPNELIIQAGVIRAFGVKSVDQYLASKK